MFRPRSHASPSHSLEWICHQCRQHLNSNRQFRPSRTVSTSNKSVNALPRHHADPYVGRNILAKHPREFTRANGSVATVTESKDDVELTKDDEEVAEDVVHEVRDESNESPQGKATTTKKSKSRRLGKGKESNEERKVKTKLGKTEGSATAPEAESAQADEVDVKSDGKKDSKIMSLKQAMNTTKAEDKKRKKKQPEYNLSSIDDASRRIIETSSLELTPLPVEQPPVPTLQYGLDRVLFNPGVYQLQDPHSRVYNFDPYLQNIMPVAEFNFNSLKEYKTSSHDNALANIAVQYGKKYTGSTSSMTSTLAHFHFLLSNWRELNLATLSRGMLKLSPTFTQINRAPNAIFLRWKNGTYAIDADKEHDSPNVLMMLGKSMELLLTQPRHTYERYRKDSPEQITTEEKSVPEAYHYTTMGDFLMRSQLDAYDPRLPGTGMFDLKTRAVVTVRMNVEEYEEMAGYEILSLRGNFESYEREYCDMLRSTMVKYMLQARMGRMDGIFVAYHNVNRVFGFQYLPLSEIDQSLHGQSDTCLGDQEFKASVALLNEVLDMATQKFPATSIRLHFETKPAASEEVAHMVVFAEPMEEDEIDKIQSKSKSKVVEYESQIMGIEPDADYSARETEPADDAANTTDNEHNPETSAETAAKSEESKSSPAADTGYLDTLVEEQQEAEATHGPLLMAVIQVNSSVRAGGDPTAEWIPCEDNRPLKLRSDEEWKISYAIEEVDDDDAVKWARYEDLKDRRRDMFVKTESEESTDEETVGTNGKRRGAKDNKYIEFLKRLSDNGRRHRARMDEIDRETAKVSL